MSQAGLAIRRRVNVRAAAASPSGVRSIRSTQKELEIKLDELRKDYAELHTAVFEAGQVHRRLCAPRLVRYGDFEIASEIFAVRHLAGDFFTVKEFNNRLEAKKAIVKQLINNRNTDS